MVVGYLCLEEKSVLIDFSVCFVHIFARFPPIMYRQVDYFMQNFRINLSQFAHFFRSFHILSS